MKISDITEVRTRLWIASAVLLACGVLGLPTAPSARAADPGAAQPDPKTIVVLGDSLAAGLGLDPNEAFPALLQNKIDAANWNFKVVNAGVSGDTTAGG